MSDAMRTCAALRAAVKAAARLWGGRIRGITKCDADCFVVAAKGGMGTIPHAYFGVLDNRGEEHKVATWFTDDYWHITVQPRLCFGSRYREAREVVLTAHDLVRIRLGGTPVLEEAVRWLTTGKEGT